MGRRTATHNDSVIGRADWWGAGLRQGGTARTPSLVRICVTAANARRTGIWSADFDFCQLFLAIGGYPGRGREGTSRSWSTLRFSKVDRSSRGLRTRGMPRSGQAGTGQCGDRIRAPSITASRSGVRAGNQRGYFSIAVGACQYVSKKCTLCDNMALDQNRGRVARADRARSSVRRASARGDRGAGALAAGRHDAPASPA
jgi:hypothetical protein